MPRKRVYVRPIRPEESKTFLAWAIENQDKSEFDPAVPLYPSSTTWCAYDEDGPLVYQTLQKPVMLESVAPRPGADPKQIAEALKELAQNCITQAHASGAGEIFFLGTDAETDDFAAKHLFEPLPYRVFRVKLRHLEGTNENNS